MTLEYRAGSSVHAVSPSRPDFQILELMSSDKNLEKSVSLIMDTEELGVPVEVERVAVVSAIDKLLNYINENQKNLPYTYGFRLCVDQESGLMQESLGGGVSGLRINGEAYMLRTGLGKCSLERFEIDKDGIGRVADARDARNMKVIKTDNMGDIAICRRRKKISIKEVLVGLREFLDMQSCSTVHKIIG